jgi:probable H4MPT-linked C1 transfer pathway protein
MWMGPRGFGSVEKARQQPLVAASANFLAAAEIVARRLGEGLLVDMGSTTTDIIPVVSGHPASRGLSDGERLATGELVYTGLTRTDVSAVAHEAPYRGRPQRLAAGGFATMADVRRVLGELSPDVDQHETADRRGKSLEESVARLARCFGRDSAEATLDDWKAAARSIADQQTGDIRTACRQVLAATPVAEGAPVVAAGIGAPLIEALAADLGRPCRPFGDIADATDGCRMWATRCAPAVAVALLADAD